VRRRLQRERQRYQLVQNKSKDNDWDNMVALMKRNWFSRRWVVQEIALASNAMMLCGPHSIDWYDFADAVSMFNDVEAEKQTISRAIMKKEKYQYRPRYFGNVQALSATRLVEVTNELFRRRADHEKVALMSLEQLVSSFTAFNATEPRDTIYSLLAIAKDTMPRTSQANMRNMVASYTRRIQEKFIEQLARKIEVKSYYVNYDQPVSDVFVDFVEFSISQSDPSRALDIICRPWAPVAGGQALQAYSGHPLRATFDEKVSKRYDDLGRDSVPSWIPSIAGAAYGQDPKTKGMVRKNPDTLVGIPPDRNYTAAGSIAITRALRFEQGVTRFSNYESLDGLHYHSMFVEGFVVDRIEILGNASQKGNIPKDWPQLGGKDASHDEQWPNLPDEYWRTLVVDRGKKGNPPRHYPRLINQALVSHVQGETFDTQAEIDHPSCQAVSDVLERVQSVIWNRRLMRTSNKRLGLVPEYAKEGDFIVILYGCSVPVVLRRFIKTQKEVLEERNTKLTRQRKIAARKLIETFRKFMADNQNKKEKPVDIEEPANHVASAPTLSNSTETTVVHNFGISAQDFGIGVGGQHNGTKPQNGYFQKDPDSMSVSMTSEQSMPMPGAWQDSPSISRKNTDLVAPGPILPPRGSISRNTTTSTVYARPSRPRATRSLTAESPLKSDEYCFYQVIGECYVHGIMNGEAISMQRSAEDNFKQTTARRKDQPNSPKIDTPDASVEPSSFIRTLFELR